jgi:hypothetical protein
MNMNSPIRNSLILGAMLSACAAATALEVNVPVSPVTRPDAPAFQDKAALAHGDGVYLAVWQEGAESADGAVDLRCARLAPDGKCLDPDGIALCSAPDLQLRPRIAFSGGVFLIVWEDFRNGTDGDIYAARVTTGGKVLDPDGFPVAAIKGRNQVYATVAGNGRDFLVAWMDYWATPTYGIAATRVSPEGNVATSNGVLIVKEQDAKIKKAADAARNAKVLCNPWARAGFGDSGVGTVGMPELIWQHDKYLLYVVDSRGYNRLRIQPVSAEGEVKVLPVDEKSWLNVNIGLLDRSFNRAFVAGPDQGWLFFTRSNLGRGQEEHFFDWFVVKPDGTPPRSDKGSWVRQLDASDERRIIDSNVVGAFDGTNYWLVLEDASGIAAGRVNPETGEIADLDLTRKAKARSTMMLADGSKAWCMHPAVASDGKGRVLAVWSEDAGVNNCRLKVTTWGGK